MHSLYKKEPLVLLSGDIAAFLVALWLSLHVRYFAAPAIDLFATHIVPFSFLFLVWIFVFYIAGLYESHTRVFKSRLPGIIFKAQIVNTAAAAAFFYAFPFFGITPKIVLFIDLFITIALVSAWRLIIVPHLGYAKKRRVLLIGTGDDMKHLSLEVAENPRYGFDCRGIIDLETAEERELPHLLRRMMREEKCAVVVVNFSNRRAQSVMHALYEHIFEGVAFIDMSHFYENIFNRIPLSLIGHGWVIENISLRPRRTYDILKRGMDILFSIVLGAISLVFYPFVYFAIKFDDGGALFIQQTRIGERGKHIKLYKFRTMAFDDKGEYKKSESDKNYVTRVGAFLRKTRIDELPQLLNVLKGDISLVGPRPELPELVRSYRDAVPHYEVRHIIKPGLSGWAQIYHEAHPHHAEDIEETKNKLSYDLYYVKNRSFFLDIHIALKTIRTLLSRSGA
ncbi:exopolysaccharide biosynthesis polyprenyl glycosylphosphotransferase [bacterium]|nr:exopolysaccharide biosynthesis polyprenyl glycosylphosphotransferase [bacterium]